MSNESKPDPKAPTEPGVTDPSATQPFTSRDEPDPLSEATAPMADTPLIGGYRLIEPLGEGGMGIVYRALSPRPVQREVALKLIKLGLDTRAVVARFDAERQALAIMDHPNIARALDAGSTSDGRPYFVMELVRGEPITRFCDRNKLSIRRRLELFAKVCDAVQHAHGKGVIHRDIKASNVLVSEVDGQPVPKIIDFGVAKAISTRLTEATLVTLQGRFVGTPGYVSPEQAEGSLDVDTRTDIYSLGILLYELLAGRLPFSEGELRRMASAEILRVIREVDPPRPSQFFRVRSQDSESAAQARGTDTGHLAGTLRKELEWIPLKAMRKDRSERYVTAAALAEDVRNYLEGRPLIAGPDSVSYRARKVLRRHRGAAAAALAVAAALVLGIVGTSWQAARASEAEDRAVARAAELEEARDEANEARASAENRLERHKATSRFIYNVFNGFHPDHVKGADPAPLFALIEVALERLEKDLPESLAQSGFLTLFGELFSRFGEHERAGPLFDEGVRLARESLAAAEDHWVADGDYEVVRAVVEGMQRKARWHEATGDLEGAIACSEESLATASRYLPGDHVQWVFCEFNLGTQLWNFGRDRARGMELVERASLKAEAHRQKLDPTQLANIRKVQGSMRKAVKDPDGAAAAYAAATDFFEAAGATQTLDFAELLLFQASLAWSSAEVEAAEGYLDRATAIWDELLGERPILNRRIEWDLRSRMLARRGSALEAAEALKKAMAISQAVASSDEKWLVTAQQRLTELEARAGSGGK